MCIIARNITPILFINFHFSSKHRHVSFICLDQCFSTFFSWRHILDKKKLRHTWHIKLEKNFKLYSKTPVLYYIKRLYFLNFLHNSVKVRYKNLAAHLNETQAHRLRNIGLDSRHGSENIIFTPASLYEHLTN